VNGAGRAHDHVVNFYDDDRDIVAGVTGYLAAGIDRDAAVVIIATGAHRVAVHAGLARMGVDVDHMRESNQYQVLDAAQTLDTFMVDGALDADRFRSVVAGLIALASDDGRPVRVFGEMVAVLWEAGDVAGAIELELLWDALAAEQQLSLCCGYPMSALLERNDLVATTRVCDHHSRLLPPLGYAARKPHAVPSHDADRRSQLFIPVPEAIGAVRRFVTETLVAWDERMLIGDATLVVSELATNAVRHARSAFRASISRDRSVIRIGVDDTSSDLPKMTDPAPYARGGRGVAIVDRLSTRWGTDPLADGKTVWSELSRSAKAGSFSGRR
jgi:anti-sigma regulatory factor (Ser/Thr protein kinase)